MSFVAFFDTSPSMVGLLLVGEMVVLYHVSLIPSNEMCKDYKSSFTKIVASLGAWKAMGINYLLLARTILSSSSSQPTSMSHPMTW